VIRVTNQNIPKTERSEGPLGNPPASAASSRLSPRLTEAVGLSRPPLILAIALKQGKKLKIQSNQKTQHFSEKKNVAGSVTRNAFEF